ncbi:UNVERIFIED_CONTAM: phosphopantetheine binding protein [Acetivibrio alkalicellulosi]
MHPELGAIEKVYQNNGMKILKSNDGLTAFEKIVKSKSAQILVMRGEWNKLNELFCFCTKEKEDRMEKDTPSVKKKESFLAERMPQKPLHEFVNSYLSGLISDIMKIPENQIDKQVLLQEYGLDSIKILDLNQKLEDDFSELSKTLFYEHQTIHQLTQYFMKNHKEEIEKISNKIVHGETSCQEREVQKNHTNKILFTENPIITVETSQTEEDIAIIGVSGRYPLAENLEAFWDNLKNGLDCISKMPNERQQYINDTQSIMEAGYIKDADKFDSLFFKISPKEAKSMDPQERIFLETAWHTLEDAGLTINSLKNQCIGVFVGVMYGHYQLFSLEENYNCERFLPTSLHSSIANKVSFTFDFKGPSIAIDTMCSSALTALDLGVKSIREGECDCALVGGVNLSLHPNKFKFLNQRGFVSSSRRCKSFGAGADGYIPGEGVGAILIKPLTKALKDKDHIYGIIKGTAVNHGGKANGYTVPNPAAQTDVIVKALKKAGVYPKDIDYLEVHGTGTALGDPIEITGLVNAYKEFEQEQELQICPIGSVKSNIGHLESASGIAAISKVLMQFKYNSLVPSIHTHELNPNIHFEKTPFYVQRDYNAWKHNIKNGDVIPHIVGISSFGAGGVNAHVILEEYRSNTNTNEKDFNGINKNVIVLSARNEERLKIYALNLAEFFAKNNVLSFESIAYTLQNGRESMEERIAFAAGSKKEAAEILFQFVDGQHTDGLLQGNIQSYARKTEIEKSIKDLIGSDITKAAEWWIKGYSINWTDYYPIQPYKASLPCYPFERKVCWLDSEKPAPVLENQVLNAQSFVKELYQKDFMIQHHIVDGEYILPGVGYIELVLEASAHLAGGRKAIIENLTLLKQFVISNTGTKIRVDFNVDENYTTFEVKSVIENEKDVTLYAKGQIVFDTIIPEAEKVFLDEIKRNCYRTVQPVELYNAFYHVGIEYGDFYKTVQQVWVSEEQIVSEIRQSKEYSTVDNSFLHLGIADGAIQSIAASLLSENVEINLKLPFSFGEIIYYRPFEQVMFAYIKKIDQKRCDVTICNASGEPALCIYDILIMDVDGTEKKENRKPRSILNMDELRAECQFDVNQIGYYVPEWKECLCEKALDLGKDKKQVLIIDSGYKNYVCEAIQKLYERPAYRFSVKEAGYCINGFVEKIKDLPHIDCIYFLGGIVPFGNYDIKEAVENGILSFYHLIKALVECGYRQENCEIRVIVNNINSVNQEEEVLPWHGSLIGFTKTLRKEFDKWKVLLIDIDYPNIIEKAKIQLENSFLKDQNLDEIVVRGEKVFQRSMTQIQPPVFGANSKLRRGGIYVILGGAGGIGLELAEFLIRRVHARIALIGRSTLTGDRKEKLENMVRKGDEIIYVQADAANSNSIRNAIVEIKSRYGCIHGAIHSAIVLQDRLIMNMDEETLKNVLKPKVEGSVYFYEALKEENLDFIYFFSSAQSLACNMGQSNYSAGCTFKDAFAAYINIKSPGLVKTVNWGYWGNVGIVSGEEYYERLIKNGIGSISIDEGMEAFVKILESDVPQVMAIKLAKEHLEKLKVDFNYVYRYENNQFRKEKVEYDNPIEEDVFMQENQNEINILKTVMKCVGEALEVTTDQIDERRSFLEYGIDSIIGVDLISSLNDKLGIQLKTTVIYDYTNVMDLSNFIKTKYGEVICKKQERVPRAVVSKNSMKLGSDLHRRVLLKTPCKIEDIEVEAFFPEEPAFNEVQVHIKAFSLNFGDLLCVKGLYPSQPEYPFTPGFEFAGVVVKTGKNVIKVKAGDEVIGLCNVNLGAHATCLNVKEEAVVKKPSNITMEEGCSFPIVYMTMQKAFEMARIKKGETVLIQTAAGGTGLISVQFAKNAGAEIFATAGSQSKLDYLRNLGVKHLINYRQEDFAERIMQMTNHRGVDVVFNTLAGDAIQKGISILAPGGRYIEIAMTGLKAATQVDLSSFVDNQTFYSIDLRKMFLRNPDMIEASLNSMKKILESRSIKPTVGKVFALRQIKEAYEYMQNRENIGKIIITTEMSDASNEKRKISEETMPEDAPTMQSGNSDVAIIGIAGRFPDAKNVNEFWENIKEGRSAVRPIPSSRWDLDMYYDEDYKQMDKTHCPYGGVLSDIDQFDPVFFNMSGKEAKLTDPQQRLFLQVSYHALEDAGYVSEEQLNKNKCGIFVGVGKSDYMDLMTQDQYELEAQSFWGNEDSVLPARLAYYLNLHGPCMTVNTACSSSLTALKLAVQSIVNGESEVALAGGVFIRVTPKFHIINSNAQMLSPDGKCKVFDDSANGYVPGEGAGVIVLKSLQRAVKDKDQIYGVIKGIEINQDGKTNGITAPSTLSQTELETMVYKKYHVNPETITMIEAHGTGTKLGDPIEVEALTNAFAKFTDKKGYCAIGSVKENIGHSVNAAGIASVIKVLMAMKHRLIPPIVNFETPNRHICFEDTPFYINHHVKEWISEVGKLRAGISAFGFSGTNVHMVLEEAPEKEEFRTEGSSTYPIFLSAKTERALMQKVMELKEFISKNREELTLPNVAFTLCTGREHFSARISFIVDTLDELGDMLGNYINGSMQSIFCRNLKKNLDEYKKQTEGYGDTLIAQMKTSKGGADAYRKILKEIAQLYVQGYELDYKKMFENESVYKTTLPGYPFETKSYWLDSTLNKTSGSIVKADYPLIDKMDKKRGIFYKEFDDKDPLLKDHKVFQQYILAGAVQVELALEAAVAFEKFQKLCLKNVIWSAPLELTEDNKRVKAVLYKEQGNGLKFEIQKGGFQQRLILSKGQIEPFNRNLLPEKLKMTSIMRRCTLMEQASIVHYQQFLEVDIEYGEYYKGVCNIWRNSTELLAEIRVDTKLEKKKDYVIHPIILDCAFQVTAHLETKKHEENCLLPYEIEGCYIYQETQPVSYVYIQKGTKDLAYDISIVTKEGEVCAFIQNFCLRPFSKTVEHNTVRKAEEPIISQDIINENVQAMNRLGEFACYALLRAFKKMGTFRKGGECYSSKDELKRLMRIQPKYNLLFDALLSILCNAGFAERKEDRIITNEVLDSFEVTDAVSRLQESEIQLINSYPMIRANISLLSKCLANYPAILQGSVQATDIMFPNSSMELVEGIYKGNVISDYFNEYVLFALKEYIEKRKKEGLPKGTKVKILEIGAGTGGTSLGIFKGIEQFSDIISYCYTDISNSFLIFGSKSYGKVYPYVDFKLLNISEDIQGQGFSLGEFDVIIAANVLHATKDISTTIQNCNLLLAKKGWLIVNEVTSVHDFTTLTFGLLDGWWLFEDAQRRIQGSPLLSASLWHQLLEEKGLNKAYVFGLQSEEKVIGQNVMVYKKSVPIHAKANLPVENDMLIEKVEDSIIDIMSTVLQTEKESFDLDTPYTDYGVDSILAVKIVDELNAKFDFELRSTELFNYASVGKLAEFIMEQNYEQVKKKFELPFAEHLLEEQYEGEESNQPFENINPNYEPNQDAEEDGDGIAIIGMSGKFPDAENVEEFYENLVNGKNSVREVTRWNLKDFYDSNPGVPNKSYCKNGGLLEGIYDFDPLFFNISPREAELMDPQHRLFLEESYKAFEDAGYSKKTLDGTTCCLYVGCTSGDYSNVVKESGNSIENYVFSGNSSSMLASRIAYFLNLHGASIAIDTACSSSLVAIHLACERLRTNKEEIAIAGGVMIMNTPDFFISSSQSGMVSAKGQCFTFDNEADGFVPGEGCGVVVLKSLKKAIKDGDYIYGIIRGSAMNQNGKTNGITAPSAPSQTDLECEVYDRFHIRPDNITYMEAHGTGTKLGDPIEVQALTDSFRKYTNKKQFCAIGSVKTNIGHSLTAAGVAGVIKLLLSFKYKKLFPNVTITSENQFIDFNTSPFYVIRKSQDWYRKGDKPLLAAISSFGFSGTNVHVVLEEPPEVRKTVEKEAPYHIVAISSKTKTGLEVSVRNLLKWTEKNGENASLQNVSYSLLTGRTHFEERIAFVAGTIEEMKHKLRSILDKDEINIDLSRKEIGKKEQRLLSEKGKITLENLPNTTNAEEYKSLLAELSEIYKRSCDLEWEQIFQEMACCKVPLPTYPFEQSCYRITKAVQKEFAVFGKEKLELFELEHKKKQDGDYFYITLTGKEEYFSHHKVGGKKVFPVVVYLEMVRKCGEIVLGKRADCIRNVVLEQALVQTNENIPVEIAVKIYVSKGIYCFDVYQEKGRIIWCSGTIGNRNHSEKDSYDIEKLEQGLTSFMGKDDCYKQFQKIRLQYGEAYKVIQNIKYNSTEVLALLNLPKIMKEKYQESVLNPSILDGAMQSIIVRKADLDIDETYLPYAIGEVLIFDPVPSKCYVYLREVPSGETLKKYNLQLLDKDGMEKVRITAFSVRAMKKSLDDNRGMKSLDLLLHEVLDKIYKKEFSIEEGNKAISNIVKEIKS